MKKSRFKQIKRVLMVVLLSVCLLGNHFVYAKDVKENNRYAISVIVQIVSCCKGGPSSSIGSGQHAFLIIQNESTIAVTIGHMSVPAGGYITVGTFGNRSAHSGVWYNIEAFDINNIKSILYSSRIYELESLDEVSDLNYVINYHDYWQYTYNCSHFAADCWNAITPSSMHISGGMPYYMMFQINGLPGSQAAITVSAKPITSIARHTSSGVVYDQSGAYPDN